MLNLVPGGTVASADVRTTPKAKARNAALDRARTFITVLVLIHHSVIAYTYFGHTDRQSFLGFDGVVLFNEQLLHVGDVLPVGPVRVAEPEAQGDRLILARSLWRLGLPFIVCALRKIPGATHVL